MKDTIQTRCDSKREELIDKYFGNLVYEAAHLQPEVIDESRYSMELPAKVEAEYRSFLGELLAEVAPDKNLDAILDKHHLSVTFTEDDRQQLEAAYHDAKIITLWEKLTKSNHDDVTYYKGLLKSYTEELLKWMEIDFIEDVK
ncbi:MAG: hypothetical protein MJZ93_01620 [Paludibacteraceae bacterium]|nr:hypothetical protein [Paludibacteraceae bacterium]